MLAKPFDVDHLLVRVAELLPSQPASLNQPGLSTKEEQAAPVFPLDIVFRHHAKSEPVKAFVRKMAAKLNLFGDHITRCRVVIDMSDARRRRHRYSVNIKLSTSGTALLGMHDTGAGAGYESLYLAIHMAFGAVCRQMKAYLRKQDSPGKRSRPEEGE